MAWELLSYLIRLEDGSVIKNQLQTCSEFYEKAVDQGGQRRVRIGLWTKSRLLM